MLHHVIAIASLALLCAGWLWVQRLVQRVDPDNPGLKRGCGACGCSEEERAGCEKG